MSNKEVKSIRKKPSDHLKAVLDALTVESPEATATTAPGVRAIEPELVRSPLQAPISKNAKLEGYNRRALKFLIDLAQLPESEIKGRGWGPGLRQIALLLQKAGWVTTDDLEVENPTALAHQIHEAINSFIDNQESESPDLQIRFGIVLDQKRPRVVAKTDSQHDAILYGLNILISAYHDRIRRCAANGCPQIFLANKRQTYCSAKCSKGELMRRFIEKRGGQDGYSEYRHRLYEQRVKARYGQKIKVARVQRRKPFEK